ncbi:MAG: NAD(P)/FAD-dependent oxidoreductase [Proteobacteria bacterium]|nr:NAD(P)/FAD-dependent oxidoreductase [Pseudomonadota bacterium]
MSKEAVIVGAGPAGISAAIYLVRAGVPVTIIYKDEGALGKAVSIDNYYGFPGGISGHDLFVRGLEQAKELGAKVVQDEVVGLVWEEKITVLTKSERYPADVIVLATGAARIAPKIEGLKDLEGRGVSYCAVCDAFFYRQKDVAVIGNGEYALHEATVLADTSRHVTIFTLGKEPEFGAVECDNIEVDRRKIMRLNGQESLESVELEDGSIIPVSGLFVAVGVAGSSDFARKLGAEVDGARIVVNADCASAIEGVYACGDCNGGMLQVAKAVYDGAKAASHAIKYLRSLA